MCQPKYIDYCDELIAMLADMINSFIAKKMYFSRRLYSFCSKK